MILTEEEIKEIQEKPFSQNDWLWFYTRAIEQSILNKLQDKLKNAERYEWLRNMDKSDCCLQCGYDAFYLKVGNELDKAIDSAMKGNNNDI